MALSPDSSDVQYLLVLDQYYNWIDTILWQRSNAQIWQYYQYNLNVYPHDLRGFPIRLQFGTFNNGYSGVTSMFVDDVSLVTCQ